MFKKVTITDAEGNPYLTRWVLLRIFGFKVYLHKIWRSDADRDLHDHPWPFFSFLLWGSYLEQTKKHRQGRRIRFFNPRLRAEEPHRLVLDRGPVTTLVFVGRKHREWGFHTETGWMHHRDFLDLKFGRGQWEDVTSQYD